MDRERRRLLVAVGGGLVLAGCLGDDEDVDPPAADDGNDVEVDDDDVDGDETDADDGAAGDETDDTDDAADDDPAPDADVTVDVTSNDFDPDLVMIEPGETVAWVHESGSHTVTTYHEDNGVAHRVTSDVVLDEPIGNPDDGVAYTFDVSGVYDYFCRPHEGMGMIGSIVVGEPESDDPGLAAPQDDLPDGAAAAIEDLNARVREELNLAEPADNVAVAVNRHDAFGEFLVDGAGRTLYMFDHDEQGEGNSGCTGDCAENWPPLIVEEEPVGGADVDATLTTFDRADETVHVAANGWPLYGWIGDEEPGDVTGQGVNDAWWMLTPAGEPIRDETDDEAPEADDDDDGPADY